MRLVMVLCCLFTGFVAASPANKSLKVYFDADRSVHYSSARAIEMGVKTAFDEVNNQLNGVKIEFVELDHRGNVARSKKNMKRYSEDPQAIALFAGLHSPPLIKYRDYINENQLLILNPWAAGGPITRYPSKENYVFRLSVDDTKVGKILVRNALSEGCQRPHLLLEDTPWGKSNFGSMTRALESQGNSNVKTTWFHWGIDDAQARIMADTVKGANADCVMFVGNAIEGPKLITALANLDSPPKVYSHWGITGGTFNQNVALELQERVSLQFVQSCFNFYSSPKNAMNQAVFQRAKRLFPDDIPSNFIKSPAGFVHGYDLAKLMIIASEQIEFTESSVTNRSKLKAALETMSTPVEGLVKQYQTPFTSFTPNNLDAHEALTEDDLCMAKYRANGAIVINDMRL
jgi:branched-chain amino acid transport system substrate-binding protein